VGEGGVEVEGRVGERDRTHVRVGRKARQGLPHRLADEGEEDVEAPSEVAADDEDGGVVRDGEGGAGGGWGGKGGSLEEEGVDVSEDGTAVLQDDAGGPRIKRERRKKKGIRRGKKGGLAGKKGKKKKRSGKRLITRYQESMEGPILATTLRHRLRGRLISALTGALRQTNLRILRPS